MSSKTVNGGHRFDFDTHACTRCGLTEEFYEDHVRPCQSGRRGAVHVLEQPALRPSKSHRTSLLD